MNRLFAEPNQGRPWGPPVDIQETENELIHAEEGNGKAASDRSGRHAVMRLS
jgi:hypothetical protein